MTLVVPLAAPPVEKPVPVQEIVGGVGGVSVQLHVSVADSPTPMVVDVPNVHDGGFGVADTVTRVHAPQLSTSLDSVMRPVSPLDALSAHARRYHVPAANVAFIDAMAVPPGVRLPTVTAPRSVAFEPDASVARWNSAGNDPPVAAGPLLVTVLE